MTHNYFLISVNYQFPETRLRGIIFAHAQGSATYCPTIPLIDDAAQDILLYYTRYSALLYAPLILFFSSCAKAFSITSLANPDRS